MSSSFGQYLRLSIFGQSHGPAVGITVEGLPAGMRVDEEALRQALARRAPGRSPLTTPRREQDEPEFLSGIRDGVLTGQPLCAIFRSRDQHSGDYEDPLDRPRPGHADYTGHVRFYGFEDSRGGGSFSGRLTAPLVLAGALAAQFLRAQGIRIASHISRLGSLRDDPIGEAGGDLGFLAGMVLPTLRPGLAGEMEALILRAKAEGDSLGGAVTCRVDGLPAGLGAPFFDSVESTLARLLFSVPGIKAVSFGDGFDFAGGRGSEMNDAFRVEAGRVVTATNHSGGVNGGITNGMPLLFTCAVRPTPSIARPQETVSLSRMENVPLTVRGRHDPCLLPRVCPVVEAVAATGLTELWMERLAFLHQA
ncbi:MAG: chorismate synthase [Clostridia bacterium]|nr:chorismate synthase [Clostridia bacterium]